MLYVQFHKQAATANREVLVTFSSLPAPVIDVATFAANQTEGTVVTITTDGKMISGGASSLVKEWLNAVFVYVTATQA